ncbi:MAG: tetratricopeptide repeat protein [Planctomycetes bacterium]|nr:tetratricopeptide repeat protein [Planctomycetota bacterium]
MKSSLLKPALALSLALLLGFASGCGTAPMEASKPSRPKVTWFTRSPDERPQSGERNYIPPEIIKQASVDQSERKNDYQSALELYRQRRFHEALEYAERSIRISPKSFSSYSLKGDCLYELLRFEEASQAYQIAQQLKPTYYPALRGLGFVYLNQGNRNFQQGRSLEASGNYKNSLRYLREAMQQNPKDPRTAYGRAFAAEGMAKFNYDRAVNLRAGGDLQGAETMYDRCMKFSKEALDMVALYQQKYPREVEPKALVGRVSQRMAMLDHEFGRPQQAEVYLQHAIASWQSILTGKHLNNPTAKAKVAQLTALLKKWRDRQQAAEGR